MMIVKVGGGTSLNKQGIVEDIKNLEQSVIFVHGASVQRDQLAEQLNEPTKTLTSPSGMTSVYTDQRAVEILTMAYAGLVNKQWVQAFQNGGVNALGLSGVDGKIWQGERKKHLIAVENSKQKLISDTYTGKVTQTNADLLSLLSQQGYLPVITQPAFSSDGHLINTDNDRNLAVLARDLKASEIVVLFEAPGLLTDINNPSTKVDTINHAELDNYLQYAKSTMKKKVLGAKEAFANGVTKIYWGDSRVENPIRNALQGNGTIIQ